MINETRNAVLISIHPKWCFKIYKLLKNLELRKTKPNMPTPFKCYIYCTKDQKQKFWNGPRYCYVDDHSHNLFDRCGNGMVIGEFTCDGFLTRCAMANADIAEQRSCVRREEIFAYANGKEVYGWHITEPKFYVWPRRLKDFGLTRAPQSWCYVKEVA